MRVHCHLSFPSQLVNLRCYSYLSVLYFPSFHRVFTPSCFPFLSFLRCNAHRLRAAVFPLRAPLLRSRPVPCVRYARSASTSLSHAYACMLSYLSVHEHSLICHCIISSVLAPFPVCATQAAYTRHSLPLPSTVVFRRELSRTILHTRFHPATACCRVVRSGRPGRAVPAHCLFIFFDDAPEGQFFMGTAGDTAVGASGGCLALGQQEC